FRHFIRLPLKQQMHTCIIDLRICSVPSFYLSSFFVRPYITDFILINLHQNALVVSGSSLHCRYAHDAGITLHDAPKLSRFRGYFKVHEKAQASLPTSTWFTDYCPVLLSSFQFLMNMKMYIVECCLK